MKLILGLIVGVGLLVGGLWYLSGQDAVDPKLLEVKTSDWQKGPTDGKLTLIEYADFECPACGAYYPVLKDMQETFKDTLHFVYRPFPLMGHKNGMASALAAEAAGKQGKFWEMYDLLYKKQKEWSGKPAEDKGLFDKYATELGLNMDQFKQDRDSNDVKDKVEAFKKSGEDLNLQGTPTFFLNGEQIKNPGSPEAFKSLLQTKLDGK